MSIEKVMFQKHDTVVFGLGKTGLSCARFLVSEGVDFCMVDTRENPPGKVEFLDRFPDVDFYFGGIPDEVLTGAREIVLSPGVSPNSAFIKQAEKAGVSVVGDLEKFAENCRQPIVAITGSNAKTTVTSLLGYLAGKCGKDTAIAGNIGTPMLDVLDSGVELFVLELSSFQLDLSGVLKPLVATVLNVSEDHLDRYSSMQEYVESKQRIYKNAQHIVFNRADKNTWPESSPLASRTSFGLDAPKRSCDFGLLVGSDGEEHISKGKALLLPVNSLMLKGRHNVENVMAALALGEIAGLQMKDMLPFVKTFKGLPHRCEYVGSSRGVDFYNDSKGTNVGAAVAALQGLQPVAGKVVLIAGGEGKGADFKPLAEVIRKHARAVVLIGMDAASIADAIAGAVDVVFAVGMGSAVDSALELAEAGDVVLLSPACASFDMFRNFEERGEQFVQQVSRLEGFAI